MKSSMIRLAAVAIFAALCATTVSAQSVKYPNVHFGIRVGGTFNSASGSGGRFDSDNGDGKLSAEGRTFFTGGLAFDWRIASIPLYLETGAYLVDRSVNVKYEYDGNDYDEENVTVQVPLLLSYHLYVADKAAVQPFAGGFVGYGEDLGFGLRFGVGFNYGRLYANVGYDLDLSERDFKSDVYYLRDAHYKAPGLFATIGFNFGGSR